MRLTSILALATTATTLAAGGVNVTVNATVDSHIDSVTVKSGNQTLGTIAKNGKATWMAWAVGTAYTPTFTGVATGYSARWSIKTNDVTALSGGAENTITIPQAQSLAYAECELSFYGTAKTYTLTLNPNGGTFNGSTSTYTYPSANSPALPTYGTTRYCAVGKPSRTGYAFAGWYSAASGGVQVYDADGNAVKGDYWTESRANGGTWKYDGNVTVYAHWTAKTYTLTLNPNGGTFNGSTSTYAYPNANSPALPTYGTTRYGAIGKPLRTGYTFTGWYSAVSGGYQVYDANGRAVKCSVWTDTYANNGKWQYDGNVTVYARWTANTYTVTLDRQNGSGGSASVAPVYAAAMPQITKPARMGYDFGGYYSAANGGGTQYYTAAGASARTWNIASNATLYAKWAAKQYTLVVNPNGGIFNGSSEPRVYSDTKLMTGTSRYRALSPATRTGYTFLGYFDSTSGGNVFLDANGRAVNGTYWSGNYDAPALFKGLSSTSATSLSVYAHWSQNKYHIMLNQQGGSGGADSVEVAYDAAFPRVAMPTRSGYRFGGYYTQVNGGGDQCYSASGTPSTSHFASNATIYAKWTVNPTVNFVTYEGTLLNGWTTVTNYEEGVGLTLPAANDIARSNYSFDGWYLYETLEGDRVTRIGAGETGNRTFYAKWIGKTYNVAFNANGGSGQGSQTLSMTDSDRLKTFAELRYITAPRGYSFDSWNTAADGSGDSFEDGSVVDGCLTNVANATVTLFAQWTPNPYEVAFQPNGADGDETMENQSFTYDVAQSLDEVEFTYTGHAFAGWSTVSNRPTSFYEDGAEVLNLATGGVVNLYANWTGIVYTVTFNANGGTGNMDQMVCTYGVPTNLAACAFVRDGWGFSVWTNGEGDVVFADRARVTNLTAAAGAEVVLLACWTGATYAVTLDARDSRGNGVLTDAAGAASSVVTNFYVVGEEWNLPVITNVNDHLSFVGWEYVTAGGVVTNASGAVPPPSVGATNLVAKWSWVVDDLAAAVDAPELEFKTFGTSGSQGHWDEDAYTASWFAQTNFVHESTNAVQSSVLPVASEEDKIYASWLTTVVEGKGTLTFWWKCAASERGEYETEVDVIKYGDSLHFGLYDGNGGFVDLTAELEGDVDWCKVTYPKTDAGSVTFAWKFQFKAYNNEQRGGGTGWVDRVTWTPEGSSDEATPTHGVAHAWLRETFGLGSASDEELEAKAEENSPNGKSWPNGASVKVWQDYWAGTDPNNPNELFHALIAVTNGVPTITWWPDMRTGSPSRVYRILCAPVPSANAADWVAWPGPGDSGDATNQFFKVELDWEESRK